MTRRLVEYIERRGLNTPKLYLQSDLWQPTREKAEAAYFAWMEAISPELYATYTPLMLTIEEWGEIFAHFDQARISGAFVE
jgi:hypothetical protein